MVLLKEAVISFLENEIRANVTPSAAVIVKHQGKTLVNECLGTNSLKSDCVNVTNETLYDMASLTKVMCTLPAMLILLERGALHLNDSVSYFLPAFAKHSKAEITVRQLLTHSSGLIAHRPYFEQRLSYDQVLQSIYEEELQYKPDNQVVYSDLGYILLGQIIQEVSKQPLNKFVEEQVFQPLQMKNTMYLPKVNRAHIAATEYLPHLEDHKYGIVHDDNTEFMGGISGHAGLFSTLNDVEIFCSMLTANGSYEGKQLLHPKWLALSKQNYTPFSNESRGLGWQMKGFGPSPIGDLMSTATYGHTGYTGTSFYIDPVNEVTIILLTNRVYFGRHSAMIRLRPRLHNLILSHL